MKSMQRAGPQAGRADSKTGSESVLGGFLQSSRLALMIGFGGLLLIMGLAGVDALRVLQRFRLSDEQIRSRYLAQNHVLNVIRSDVYLSGTYVRDYLLEPDSERAESYRVSLQNVRKEMDSAL